MTIVRFRAARRLFTNRRYDCVLQLQLNLRPPPMVAHDSILHRLRHAVHGFV